MDGTCKQNRVGPAEHQQGPLQLQALASLRVSLWAPPHPLRHPDISACSPHATSLKLNHSPLTKSFGSLSKNSLIVSALLLHMHCLDSGAHQEDNQKNYCLTGPRIRGDQVGLRSNPPREAGRASRRTSSRPVQEDQKQLGTRYD